MSKTGRKWLKTNWADPDCVRAQDIPYSETESVKTRLDNVYPKSETYTKIEVDNLVSGSGGTSPSLIDDIMMYT